MRDAAKGRLPERYSYKLWDCFRCQVSAVLENGQVILDIGSGARPAVPVEHRPDGCRYIGLDISASELELAPAGSYDELRVADITRSNAQLAGSCDLALSYQALEHIKPLPDALEQIRGTLRPGGVLVAQLSGTFSLFGLLNKVIPHRSTVWLVKTLRIRKPERVFPAHYHRCWEGAIRKAMAPWSDVRILSLHRGAQPYFNFSRLAQAAYVGYEEWVLTGSHGNLAPYYIIVARR
jgi:SAM-dependent methyltransferase